MKRLIWHWVIAAAALYLTSLVMQQWVTINPWYTVFWLAPLLGLINVVVGFLARILAWIAFPVNLLTLGCFGFILSFFCYAVAIHYLGSNNRLESFHVSSLWASIGFAIVMALFSSIINIALPGKDERRR